MNYKKLGTLLLAAVATTGFGASARGVSINFTDGSDSQVVAVGEIANITVSGDDLVVNFNSGDPLTFAIASISNISFGATSGLNLNMLKSGELKVVVGASAIVVDGVENSARLVIYDAGGVEVLNRQVVSGSSVSIAELPAGIYVANVESTTVKFLKK